MFSIHPTPSWLFGQRDFRWLSHLCVPASGMTRSIGLFILAQDGMLSQASGRRKEMTGLLIPAVRTPHRCWMVFLKTTAAPTARTPCAVCRACTGQGKCGAEMGLRWGERPGWSVPLNASPQLGVNNDSVLGLYCFWLRAFFRNNCNSCQGSFCPQLRGENKEQRWECPI